MNEKVNAKEDLINMLSEIHNQLEKLETVLDSNFANIREQWKDDYSDQLSRCSNQLHLLETENAFQNVNSQIDEQKERFQRPTSIKLELGF
ncbi:hypothetical protein F7731_01600 [Cytobacillus depressus]|uniref:Uncharacterized protein n=1 Tax=Cytobacillus depressus TaxID=1602942 RepID=A0A6L3VG99_9BACI|nr:hypothetical protein [Cytobacillus depressus]KAB2338285.1 hypothetical protein F7731_01600 [Cytobacillus depressus]